MSTDRSPPGGADQTVDPMGSVRRRSRRIAWAFALGAAALIPWIAYLAVSLPKRTVDTHYRGAWVGFDLLLVTAVILTAYFALRVDARVQFPATATATLLVVDAWFDVMTAGGRAATTRAVLMAVCVELPAAAFSLYVARQVNHNLDRLTQDGETPIRSGVDHR